MARRARNSLKTYYVFPERLAQTLREIGDPRRLAQFAFVPFEGRIRICMSAFTQTLSTEERSGIPIHPFPKQDARYLAYLGSLQVGDAYIISLQGDPRLLPDDHCSISIVGNGGTDRLPIFHRIVQELLLWLDGRDIFLVAPRMHEALYGAWFGRERFVRIRAIEGRPVEHIRVWPGSGFIATNGTNKLWSINGEEVLAVAEEDASLNRGWVNIFETTSGIIFPSCVRGEAEAPEVVLHTHTGRGPGMQRMVLSLRQATLHASLEAAWEDTDGIAVREHVALTPTRRGGFAVVAGS